MFSKIFSLPQLKFGHWQNQKWFSVIRSGLLLLVTFVLLLIFLIWKNIKYLCLVNQKQLDFVQI